jgi:hypothetical protein
MGIFGKKSSKSFVSDGFDDSPKGQRKLSIVMDLANSLLVGNPDLSLELIAGVQKHPELHKVRGWAYAEKEELSKALEEFEKGFDEGHVGCGIYLHRLLRDVAKDEDRFHKVEAQLLPYFESKNVSFMYAQARLALRKKDYESAIGNMITIMRQTDQPTVDLFGGSFFNAFRLLSQDFAEKVSKDPENPTEEEFQSSWELILNFFDNELKTAEGHPLEWNPFFYFFDVAEYLFREIEEGNYRSASLLDEFNNLYVELMQELNPPKPPRTFTKDFIWQAILKSLEKGDLFTILMAGDFAKENGFPASGIKQYEDELNEWGLRKYLYL